MPKYMFIGTYTPGGLNGLLEEVGSSRREAAMKAVSSLGGEMESYYFSYGDKDFYIIVDMPDNANATAAFLVGYVSGAFTIKTVVLLTPEENDEVVKKGFEFRPSGH